MPGLALVHLEGAATGLPPFFGKPLLPVLPDFLKSTDLLTIRTWCSFLISTSADLSMANNSARLFFHAMNIVLQHEFLLARGQRLQHPINCQFIWNLTFQSLQALNV